MSWLDKFLSRGAPEIKWEGADYSLETDRDMTGAFNIENTHPLWLAVHQTLDELEKEVIETARKCSANPALSNYHIGASEGISMARMRLIEKRGLALKQSRDLINRTGT